MKAAMLVIATNKYIRFVAPLWESAKKHFLKGHDVTMFVFTDADSVPDGCVKVPHFHEPWPGPTLHRYHTFLKARDQLLTQDYLYYSDADMLFVNSVGDEVIGDLVATIHPGFYNKPKTEFSYERRPESMAYIAPGHGSHYFAGGFNGGRAATFLRMAEEIKAWCDQDERKGIVPVWHDESFLQRFLIGNPPTVKLSPSYCFPEAWSLPFEKRLLALDKNHAEMRS
jgi:histo-blood group ABO system transferase